MAVTRQKKESILKDLAEQIKKARMIVFINFHGLSTSATQKLRNLMRAGFAQYKVAKKTLIKKALGDSGISGEIPDLGGEVGLIFVQGEEPARNASHSDAGGEIANIAKNIAKFIKEHKELSILGGILENKFIEKKMISELAVIPSREVLLANLVYALNSPLRRLVGGLEGNLQKFVIVISKIKK
jgi:large subunit ribosomal protein L10